MSIRFSLGKRLLRAAVSLGFFGCLIAANTVSTQAATRGSTVVASRTVMGASLATPGYCGGRCATLTSHSDLTLTVTLAIDLPDEFGVAFEDDDSLEMLRVDIEERTYGIDRYLTGPGVASTAAHNIPSNFTPPLLV